MKNIKQPLSIIEVVRRLKLLDEAPNGMNISDLCQYVGVDIGDLELPDAEERDTIDILSFLLWAKRENLTWSVFIVESDENSDAREKRKLTQITSDISLLHKIADKFDEQENLVNKIFEDLDDGLKLKYLSVRDDFLTNMRMLRNDIYEFEVKKYFLKKGQFSIREDVTPFLESAVGYSTFIDSNGFSAAEYFLVVVRNRSEDRVGEFLFELSSPVIDSESFAEIQRMLL